MSAEQAQRSEVSQEARKLGELMTQLFVEASELALWCSEITEEDIRMLPKLRDLREACRSVARVVREIMHISKRRTPET